MSIARARAHIVLFLMFEDILNTASKSPLLAIGKPASITSTLSFSNTFAILNFSDTFIDAPGLCSPSLRVVSNITSLSFLLYIFIFIVFAVCIISFFKLSKDIHY